MKRMGMTCMIVTVAVFLIAGCSTAPKSEVGKAKMDDKVQNAKDEAIKSDPGLEKFFDEAAGYAVFPTVGKGGIGVGGAFGKGEVYEGGQLAGYCKLTQASIGFQLGGQSYTELIFFETKEALDRFKTGKFAFSAQASAVALKSGASANAEYMDGVAVFTMGESGLMYEASIGGQKFSYQPKE